ncbi:MAG: 2Fe-2S iron-sulfur cluster binding domain-containing protein [Rhodobacteraceae bacterium]|nr:2Fe-2S iron-sulfur cluster binding domain-containing protein [Paracoccaceae bacterium]
MPRFHSLEITNIRRETDAAVVLTLSPQSGDFRFEAGQYLTFRKDFNGVELRRCYSVCAAPEEALQIGIKAVKGGTFSSFANEALKVGDVLDAMPPMGNFGAKIATNNLGFAGGSGITPLLSIIKTTLQADKNAHFTLIYANQSVASTMFRDELQNLKDRFLNRFQIIHILEDNAQDINLFSGRLDAEKLEGLFKGWVNIEAVDQAFICGPAPMMEVVKEGLRKHLDLAQISIEQFLSDQPGRAAQKAAPLKSAAPRGALQATILLDGVGHEVVLDAETSVLQAALNAQLDAPYACRAGVCSTCKARLVEGEVEMRANQALEDYEVEQGYILTCQSHAKTARIVVDYDG